jgi:23S rRNA C2498 (ribose-2'-O)-methylase RlmM
MFEIQHAALREAQREIERLKAQHYAVWLGARPGGWGIAAWLRRVLARRPASSPAVKERSA